MSQYRNLLITIQETFHFINNPVLVLKQNSENRSYSTIILYINLVTLCAQNKMG